MNPDLKRIFFVTSSIPETKSDWKSVFIRDMLEAFSDKNVTIYWGPEGFLPNNVINSVTYRTQHWLNKMVLKGGIANILRSGRLIDKIVYPIILLFGIRSGAKKYKTKFDSYFVNWLQNALLLPSDGKDLVITVLGSDMGLLNSVVMRYFLKRVFKKHKTTLIPNAEWMVEKLQPIFGDVAEIKFLPLGIQKDWFMEIKKQPSTLLSVSRITDKKVRTLLDWGKDIFSDKNQLTLIGPNQESIPIPDWIDSIGSVTMDELKNIWYPKAKALLFLSEHDEGRPQTIVEAMAAGVPVVCLDKPLYREFIEPGFTGYLVTNKNELISALTSLENKSHNLEMSCNARQAILEKVGTWEHYVGNVNKIFND